jgi:hypothetical protein
LPVALASVATATLLATPFVTGLIHHWYTEILLLICLCGYVRVLVVEDLTKPLTGIYVGFWFGLGMLTKSTFLSLVILPTLWLIFLAWKNLVVACNMESKQSPEERQQQPHQKYQSVLRYFPKSSLRLLTSVLLAGIVAAACAAPWYMHNLVMMREHALQGFSCSSCSYPPVRAFLAMLSAGPSLPQSVLACGGVVVIAWIFQHTSCNDRRHKALVVIVLIALVTLLSTSIAINKATRFAIAVLPFMAVAAVLALNAVRYRKAFILLFLGMQVILVAHNSFALLGTMRFGHADVRLIDYAFPLNVPDWFDDNVPLITEPFHLDELVQRIGYDVHSSAALEQQEVALVAADCLYFNHNLLGYIGRLEPIWYLPWWVKLVTQSAEVRYIVQVRNERALCPGRYYSLAGADFFQQLAMPGSQFREIFAIQGRGSSQYVVYRRR